MKANLIQSAKTTGNKYAIALSANANRGKTSILRKLADEFRYRKQAVIADMAAMSGEDEMWCLSLNGVRICVVTGGDDSAAIDKGFDFANRNKCQILFCATHYYSNASSKKRFVQRCQQDGYIPDWQSVNAYSRETLEVMHEDVARNALAKML